MKIRRMENFCLKNLIQNVVLFNDYLGIFVQNMLFPCTYILCIYILYVIRKFQVKSNQKISKHYMRERKNNVEVTLPCFSFKNKR